MLLFLAIQGAIYAVPAQRFSMDFFLIKQGQYFDIFFTFLKPQNKYLFYFNIWCFWVLINICERSKGTVLFWVDLVWKNFLINSLSLALFFLLFSLQILFPSLFSRLLLLQENTTISGIFPVMLTQILIRLVTSFDWMKLQQQVVLYYYSMVMMFLLFPSLVIFSCFLVVTLETEQILSIESLVGNCSATIWFERQTLGYPRFFSYYNSYNKLRNEKIFSDSYISQR